jgi:hypothetical protein
MHFTHDFQDVRQREINHYNGDDTMPKRRQHRPQMRMQQPLRRITDFTIDASTVMLGIGVLGATSSMIKKP